MRVLVTGNAGFIGFHTVRKLLARGDSVVGIDSVNDYYDPSLKEARLATLEREARAAGADYTFVRGSIADAATLKRCFDGAPVERVINLAAQAGVRYSLVNPYAYVESNLIGFTNVLEACRHNGVAHLTYASTSSVYGGNRHMPFSEGAHVDHPLQFYAATKRANELMAHSYSHLFRLPTTGLRFFTVYGPWGRPDMALFLFLERILSGTPIQLFNFGKHSRAFTYVGDIVEGIVRASDVGATPDPAWDALDPDPATSDAPFRVYNIGSPTAVGITEYLEALEEAVGKKAVLELLPLQPGDVPDTSADVRRLEAATGYQPSTPVREGVRRFVEWYCEYYGVKL